MNATALADLSADDLTALLDEQRAAYEQLKAQGLKLDLTRGKPSAQQLDLADDLLRLPTSTKDASGVDVRNYGGLEGLRELREMFAELLWVEPEQVVAGGNSSLSIMRDCLVWMMLFGARRLASGRGARRTRSGSCARYRATTDTSRCSRASGSRW